jgi:hypothetical protein
LRCCCILCSDCRRLQLWSLFVVVYQFQPVALVVGVVGVADVLVVLVLVDAVAT